MGESTAFRCGSCGYESLPIRWGVSMSDPRRRFMPAECLECKTFVEVDLTGADMLVDEFYCPSCKAQVFFIEKGDSYTCPKCRQARLGIHQGESYW